MTNSQLPSDLDPKIEAERLDAWSCACVVYTSVIFLSPSSCLLVRGAAEMSISSTVYIQLLSLKVGTLSWYVCLWMLRGHIPIIEATEFLG